MSYSRDLQRTNAATFLRSQEAYDAMQPRDYHEDEPICVVCGEYADRDGHDGPICEDCLDAPECTCCGSSAQVWVNQDTEKMTCHRFGCFNNVIEEK